MSIPATEKFDAEAVLQDAYNDTDSSLEELRRKCGVNDIDELKLVEDLHLDPTVDGVLLQEALNDALNGKEASMGKIIRAIVTGKLNESQYEKYADLLSRDTLRDGDQTEVEQLFAEIGSTRGDVKKAITAIALECAQR